MATNYFGAIGDLVGGAFSKSQYDIGRDQTKRADDRFDRQSIFDTARSDYLKKLQGLDENPDEFLNSDMFRKKQEFGMEALNRQLGTRGLQGSGAEKAALFDYGSRTAFEDWNKERDRLAGWAGANHFSDPASLLNAQTQGGAQNAKQGGNAVTGLISGIGKLFGG